MSNKKSGKSFIFALTAVIIIVVAIIISIAITSDKFDYTSATTKAAAQSGEINQTKNPAFVNPFLSMMTEEITTENKTEFITEAPKPSHDDFTCFDDCAFIGNSRIIGFRNYGLCKNVYSVVGLNADTIFTAKAPGSDIPLIDEVKNKGYKKIYIMLGDNECGWDNKDTFIEKYSEVIDAVKVRAPEAEIYIQSVMPVTHHASSTNKFGCTNENISIINSKLVDLAKEKAVIFTNAASSVIGADGTLPDEGASDGIHLNKEYCEIWLNYLIDDTF